ncbi:DUF190 domain-containing protein [Spirosoma aerophilum]|jgi:PII-like signaling protein|nr:MAG: hypothetical protein EOO39_22855 [Cytophagaceae bacterium]
MNHQPLEWSQRCSLRIYVTYHQVSPNSRFWHRHFGPSLGQKLLQLAKAQDVHQAILYHTKAGYLAKEGISHHFAESTPASHPLCLELIDTYEIIHAFIEKNRPLLQEALLLLTNLDSFQRVV